MSMPLGGVVMFVLGDYRDTMWGKTLRCCLHWLWWCYLPLGYCVNA